MAANNSNNNNNDDFLAKAQAATQRVVASAATQQTATEHQTKIVQELAQDRPTIHSAITSFLSVVAARSLVAPEILSQQQKSNTSPLLVLTNAEALQCSRALLKAVNSTTLCATAATTATNSKCPAIDKEKAAAQAEEYDLVAQVWNGLVASEQKPARFLGRRSLRHAWRDVVSSDAALAASVSAVAISAAAPTIVSCTSNAEEHAANLADAKAEHQQQQLSRFVQEFERLLFVPSHETMPEDDDDDSALIWNEDGGTKELQRRRDRRQKRATNNTTGGVEDDEADQKLPFIEELAEGDDEDEEKES